MLIVPALALIIGIVGLVTLRRGAIFVPMRREVIGRVVKMLEINAGDRAVDLGSGDGRVVIALALAGAEAHGYEHNPVLVWWSRLQIRRAGLSGRAFIHQANFWSIDFSQYTIFTVFGISYIMEKLEEKLEREAVHSSRIVSYLFPLPNKKESVREKGVYLYKV